MTSPDTPTHPHPPAPWLRAGRVALREFTFAAGDAASVAELHARPEVRALLADAHPLHRPEVAERFVQRIEPFYRAHPGLGIWHASTPAGFVGWFSLMPMAERAGAIELGSRLRPEAWGRGVALDGGEGLLDHAFGALAAPEVWAACDASNRGARLCLATLGFHAEGMAPYDGAAAALHHRVSRATWQGWRQRARRERLRDAARRLA